MNLIEAGDFAAVTDARKDLEKHYQDIAMLFADYEKHLEERALQES